MVAVEVAVGVEVMDWVAVGMGVMWVAVGVGTMAGAGDRESDGVGRKRGWVSL